MRVLCPAHVTLGGLRCSLTVVDSHPDTQGTLWQAAPLHAHVSKVKLGAWLHVWRAPEDSEGNPMPTTSTASARAECGAARVMEAARRWPEVESILVASHRQVQNWHQRAECQQLGKGNQGLQAATPETWTKQLSAVGVLATTSDISCSPTSPGTTFPDMAGQLHYLTECMATPGWLIAYLLHWAPKRIRTDPRRHAYEALCALLGLCTCGHSQWVSAGGATQVQDGRVIDWGQYVLVEELLPDLTKLDQAWLDCRAPWSLSTAMWAVATALLGKRPMPRSSTHRHAMANFLNWAVGQISARMNRWARGQREPARDIDQLVCVQRRRLRTRLPADLRFRLAERKHPRQTLVEWQASGLKGGCNTGQLIQDWNHMYQTKGERVLSEALTLNLTLDATQAGGNSLEVTVVWGVEVQKAVYAPPQACRGERVGRDHRHETARTKGASLQAGICRRLQGPDSSRPQRTEGASLQAGASR